MQIVPLKNVDFASQILVLITDFTVFIPVYLENIDFLVQVLQNMAHFFVQSTKILNLAKSN